MKRLLLLRHGEAAPAGAAGTDFERALTSAGREQALQAAQRLRQAGCVPDAIVASPALRARSTALIVAEQLQRLHALHYEASAYPGTPEALLALVAALPRQIHTLLLVGHNPGLSELARRLAAVATASAEPAGLSTGALCRIDLAGERWSQIESGATDVTLLS